MNSDAGSIVVPSWCGLIGVGAALGADPRHPACLAGGVIVLFGLIVTFSGTRHGA